MAKIEYKPKPKREIKIGEYVFQITPPITKIYPKLLELNKYGLDVKDASSLDPRAINVIVEIIIDSLSYNYPETPITELELIVNENFSEFFSNIHMFLGLSDKELDSAKRMKDAESKGDIPKN